MAPMRRVVTKRPLLEPVDSSSSKRRKAAQVVNHNDAEDSITDDDDNGDTRHQSATVNGYLTPDHESQDIKPILIPSEEDQNQLDIVGSKVRELINNINKLERSLDINESKLQLPKVIVVGDQSAGKSSLVEAISGIKVPRSSGCCTRCPLHINIKASEDPWSCSIFLDKKYDYWGDAGSNDWETCWTARDQPREDFFKKVDDKVDLEVYLQRAQEAILNPGDHHSKFLEDTSGHKRQVGFSPNIVRLEIAGPGLPNLSFFDLPGVINQIETRDDEYLVKIVKKMVKAYIQDERSLVILACSMEGDLANSTAAKYIRNLGAEKRCVGVLTKPDRVAEGADMTPWKAVLAGHAFALGHSYFVTCQPGQAELERGINHEQARAKEERFFANNEPWRTKFSEFRERFGTTKLQEKLSELLVGQILDSIPILREQLAAKLANIEEELAKFPEPPPGHDSLRIVLELLSNFNIAINDHIVKGEHPFGEFRQQWRKLAEDFKIILHNMRPSINCKDPDSPSTSFSRDSAGLASTPRPRETVEILDDSDDDRAAPSSARKRVPPSEPRTPSKRANKPLQPLSGGRRSGEKPFKLESPETALTKHIEHAKRFTLSDIRQTLRRIPGSGIPHLENPKAVELLITKSQENWHLAVETLLDGSKKILRHEMLELVREHMGKWANLSIKTTALVDDFLKALFAEVDKAATRTLEYEGTLMTLNEQYWKAQRQQELEEIINLRVEIRLSEHIDKEEEGTGRSTEGQDRRKKIETEKKNSNWKDQLRQDKYAQEIEVVSAVRGYYNVASARLVDHMCQVIQYELFLQCKGNVFNMLGDKLGVWGAGALDNCVALLAEDPARESRRQHLHWKSEEIKKAQTWLSDLSMTEFDSQNRI